MEMDIDEGLRMDVELTIMCCVIDYDRNCVLMINRKKSWKGMAFPGGHLEERESVADCVKREVYEETGLEVRDLQYKGNAFFYNTDTGAKHIIWNFLCEKYCGVVRESCSEGDLYWIPLERLKTLEVAEGMELRIPLFLEKGIFEFYVEWDERRKYTKVQTVKIG